MEQDVERNEHPKKLIEQPLLTRSEVAQILRISLREWDRLRVQGTFTEIHVLAGRKGVRFLGYEIEEYIWSRATRSAAS